MMLSIGLLELASQLLGLALLKWEAQVENPGTLQAWFLTSLHHFDPTYQVLLLEASHIHRVLPILPIELLDLHSKKHNQIHVLGKKWILIGPVVPKIDSFNCNVAPKVKIIIA